MIHARFTCDSGAIQVRFRRVSHPLHTPFTCFHTPCCTWTCDQPSSPPPPGWPKGIAAWGGCISHLQCQHLSRTASLPQLNSLPQHLNHTASTPQPHGLSASAAVHAASRQATAGQVASRQPDTPPADSVRRNCSKFSTFCGGEGHYTVW